MASAETLEYRSDLCGKSCGENNCHCTNVSNNNILHHDEVNTNGIEIIAKGQSMLILALRTLRLSKSNQLNQFAVNADEQILAEEKCRPTISLREVLEHDCIDDCWIVLFDRVYNVTDFLHQHPAGADIILEHAGRDATVAFRGHSRFALNSLKRFEIGELPEKERIYRREGLLKCDELPE